MDSIALRNKPLLRVSAVREVTHAVSLDHVIRGVQVYLIVVCV